MRKRPLSPHRGRTLPGTAALLLLLMMVMTAATLPAAAAPERLRLHSERSSLSVGESAEITIEVLDAGYRPTVNDRARTVTLGQEAVGEGGGAVTFVPPQVDLPAGSRTVQAAFHGRRPGRVLLRANADGLVPAELLVSVHRQNASLLGVLAGLIAAPAWADPPDRLQIFPAEFPPVPANGRTPAEIYLLVDPPPGAGEETRLVLQASGAGLVLDEAGTPRQTRVVTLGEGQDLSPPIQVVADRPETVRLTAKVLPGGPAAQVSIPFVHPVPAEIVFAADPEQVAAAAGTQLELRLRDQDSVPLERFDGEYPVVVSASEPEAVRLDPANLVLEPGRAVGRVMLQLVRFPLGGRIEIQARHRPGGESAGGIELKAGRKSLQLLGLVGGLQVTGAQRVASGGRLAISVQLTDADGRPAAADLPRTVTLTAGRGRVEPGELVFVRGQTHAEAVYHASGGAGRDEVRADSPALAEKVLPIEVATATATLLLLASLGGLLGGVCRDVCKSGVHRLLPRWVEGRLDPGLTGDALVSALVGMVLYLAICFGLLGGLESLLPAADLRPEAPGLAFVLGVIGGFGGIVVLERLLAKLFPGGEEAAETAAA